MHTATPAALLVVGSTYRTFAGRELRIVAVSQRVVKYLEGPAFAGLPLVASPTLLASCIDEEVAR